MWTLVETPAALPGQCYFCGNAERNLYVDCGTSIEFYGALYICVDECLRSMAHMAKFLSPDLSQKILDNQELLAGENARLKQENLGLKTAVTHLTEVVNGSDGYSFPVSDTDVYSESVSIVESNAMAEPEPRPERNDLDEGTRTSDESSDDEGMANLRPNVLEPSDFSFNI